MNEEKIIIHVGIPKTATTFLQNLFFPHLEDVTYIGRPYTQENFAFNSLQFADNSVFNENAMEDEIERIKKITPAGNTILISDELFFGYALYNFVNRGMIAERLSQVVPNAEIVLFLRNQSDLILSLYNQYVKVGWFDKYLDQSFFYRPGKGFSLEEWLQGNRSWNLENRFFNHRSHFSPEHFRYSRLYLLYSRLFNKVHVFLYEDFKKDQIAILKRLSILLSTKMPNITMHKEKGSGRILNKKLNNKQLNAQLLQNKLSHISSFAKSKNHFAQVLIRSLSVMAPDRSDQNKEYVNSLLEDFEIYSDNYVLNKKFELGMENHPRKYFGNR